MSHLWPHPPYAEDQPYAHAILTTHVLFRGFETGAFISPLIGTARHIRLRRSLPPPHTPHFFITLLRSTGSSAVITTGIVAVGLVARMWGREDMEWKDRSWRLLENKGQIEVGQWSAAGMGAGAIILATSGYAKEVGWRGQVGSCGMGAAVGVLNYLVWRYGVKGGQWKNEA